jgi:dethiobiotin synthetase
MNIADLARGGGLFITGTDTGVGKTLVGAALARVLHSSGIDVTVMKPVESGVPDPHDLGEDGRLLRWACDSREKAAHITPYRLREPVAPALAACRDGVAVDWPHLLDTAHSLRARHAFLLLEGAGGLLVPLAGSRLVADLAKDLGWPLLVVARPDLGTINHTLLTLEAARARGLTVAGWVINGLSNDSGLAAANAMRMLTTYTDVPCWGVLPQVSGTSEVRVEGLARQMQGWPTVRELCLSLEGVAN